MKTKANQKKETSISLLFRETSRIIYYFKSNCLSHIVSVAFGLQLEVTTFLFCLQETGLYEYKVFGTLDGCRPELCADVYMDLMYRKHWDGYVKGKNKTPW